MRQSITRRLHPDSGIGIVELLVAVVLMGIISSVVMGGIVQAFGQQRTQLAYVDTLNSVKTGFERVTREMRAADPLLSATPHSLSLRLRRGLTCRDVSFELKAVGGKGQLVMRDPVTGPERVVAGGLGAPVAAPTFAYLDEDGVPLPSTVPANQVRDVRTITVVIKADVPNAQPTTPRIDLRDSILVRNRGGRPC